MEVCIEVKFVFSYKNAIEVTTRLELDYHISTWYSKYIYAISNWKSDSINGLFNASFEELEKVLELLEKDLTDEKISPTIELQSELDLMKYFFVNHEHKSTLLQWKCNTQINIRLRREKIMDTLEKDYKIIYNIQKAKMTADVTFNEYRRDIVKKVHTLFLNQRNQGLSLKDNNYLETTFKSIWDECRAQIRVENMPIHNISSDLQKSLIDSPIIKNMCVVSSKSDLIRDHSKYLSFGEMDFEDLSGKNSPKHFNPHYYSYNEADRRKIFRVFVSSIFSMKSKDKGIKQFKTALILLSKECERIILEYSSNQINKQCSYDSNSFFIIIEKCCEILNMYNTNQSKNLQQSIELTTDFFFDFIFHQCCKAIPVFEHIQRNFISRASIDSKLILLENQLKINFLQLCDGIEFEYVCATGLARIIMNGMKDYLSDYVSNTFRFQFESDEKHESTFQSRSSLILRILKDLARGKNFDDYISYIANPFNYITMYVQRKLVEYAEEEDVITCVVQRLVKQVNSLVKFYVTTCSETMCSRRLSYLVFYYKISHKIRNVSSDDLDILTLHNISNYQQFCELYADEMNKLVEDTDWSEWIRQILSEENTMYKSIIDNLIECKALCPFCSEPCQLAVGAHEHYCGNFHRPKGINGWRHRETNTISVKECTTIIQDKDNFYYNDVIYEYVNYRTVNETFKSWKIFGEDAMDSKYWQWVFYMFEDRFVEYYDVVKNSFVSRWSNLTEEEVVNDLEDHYRCLAFQKN